METSHLPYPIGPNKSTQLSQDLKDAEMVCTSLVTGTERSYENKCGYSTEKLEPLTQFGTFAKYRTLCTNIPYLFNSPFIPRIPCSSRLCVNWFQGMSHCQHMYLFLQFETRGGRWLSKMAPSVLTSWCSRPSIIPSAECGLDLVTSTCGRIS